MSESAKITVTSGPDRGREFSLHDELVHIGRGPANQVALSDPEVAEHQASIVSRNGRYAIYTTLEDGVEVDGNLIPVERWVWLPAEARIRLSERTAMQFSCGTARPTNGNAAPEAEARTQPAAPRPAAAKGKLKRPEKPARGAARRPEGTGRAVARFITDQGGDALVKLGEDGHLPELLLDEGDQRKPADRRSRQSNPLLVYGLVALSFVVSLVLLLVDFEAVGSSAASRASARREIAEFYGSEGVTPEPYQRLLREARLAHSRNDRDAEVRAYRRVLSLLNSEDVTRSFSGLTGDRKRDERLRKLIGTLLSE